MNVLVVGGGGYIGSHTAKALYRNGHTPIVYDDFSRGYRHAVRWGAAVEGDIRDVDRLAGVLRDRQVGAVIHFAALAYVGESVTQPQLYFDVNVIGSLRLLEAMRQADVKTVIFSSTCATYGIPETGPIDEATPQNPVNPYGETKLIVEKALKWYGQAYDIRSVALRYFNAAGADTEGEIGECHDPETHLIPLILDVAEGTRPHIDVYGRDYPTPDGTAIRDYIHVGDLASAHVAGLEYLLKGGASTALNLGTGRGYSVREVIETVREITGRPIAYRDVARREGDPPVLVADARQARRLLGWEPGLSDLDTIVRTAWHWHQHRAGIIAARQDETAVTGSAGAAAR
jgi:UDP-glucose-4-epimerase GalE